MYVYTSDGIGQTWKPSSFRIPQPQPEAVEPTSGDYNSVTAFHSIVPVSAVGSSRRGRE